MHWLVIWKTHRLMRYFVNKKLETNVRNTKIICTIGPASLNEDTLRTLKDRGLGVVRLNGSHSTLEWHASAIELVRKTIPSVPILLDIPGRKIRTKILPVEPEFEVGDIIILTSDEKYSGTDKVPVNYVNLHNDLTVGDSVMADDGRLKFTVVRLSGFDIHCRAETEGKLGSRKGINVPYVKLKTPQVTLNDKQMIDFAVNHQIDFIGLSFVESAEHILNFRSLISNRGPRIIAKVENSGGLDNVTEIAGAADAIMIDRGDLSVETSLFDLPGHQKEIIKICRKFGKPVIIATEMLHTMTVASAPTKAEVTDIANAVFDGCSATMLSGETAIGDFSIESVEVMAGVIDAAEKYMQNKCINIEICSAEGRANAVALSVDGFSKNTFFDVIVLLGGSEREAQMIAERRLPQSLIVATDNIFVSRCVNLLSGTIGFYLKDLYEPSSMLSRDKMFQILIEQGLLKDDARVLLIENPANCNEVGSDFNVSISLMKLG